MKNLLAALVVVCLGMAAGCGGSSGTGGPKKWRIAVIPKGTTHEFWKSVHAGAAKAAAEHGNVEIIWKGPQQESERDAQISLVQDFVTKHVDGLVLAPLDSQALVPYVREAKDAGIPTVIFDSALNDESDIISYVATDNFRCGALAAEYMGKMLSGKGNVILLRYNEGSESAEQRESGFLQTLDTEFPEIKVISSNQYSGTSFESALSASQKLLLKHGDQVDGVFTVCEPNSTGMLGAISGHAHLPGKVKFIAFDPNARLIEGLGDGRVSGIVLQDPVKMGYLAVKTMLEHLEGTKVERRVSTGEHIATKENMNDPQIEALLHPEQFD